jgi:hypothetical protein
LVSSEGATSKAALQFSMMVSNSSMVMWRTSNRSSQSFAQCPVFPHQRQVSGVDLALQAASMSIGTGLPGVGLLCANWVGGNVSADLDIVMSPGRELECVVGGGPDRYEAWKASSAARFWSNWTAISNHPSESVSEGLPAAIALIAEAMRRSNPRRNFTTMVLWSVYPKS